MINATRRIARFLYHRTLPAGAKNTLRLYLMWDWDDRTPEPIADFTARQVLVLAPHMDDEVIGCGGTLRRHVLAGARVTVVFLTDGHRGDPDLYLDPRRTPAERRAAERDVTRRRQAESQRASQILGLQELVFLNEPDGALTPTAANTGRLAELLVEQQPDVVYLPGLLDGHPDHWGANRVLCAALERAPRWARNAACIRQYESWNPILVNRVADITEVFDAKLAALREFASQVRIVDFVRTTTGLNTYRAIYQQRGDGYAEAFFECTPQQYAELCLRFAVHA